MKLTPRTRTDVQSGPLCGLRVIDAGPVTAGADVVDAAVGDGLSEGLALGLAARRRIGEALGEGLAVGVRNAGSSARTSNDVTGSGSAPRPPEPREAAVPAGARLQWPLPVSPREQEHHGNEHPGRAVGRVVLGVRGRAQRLLGGQRSRRRGGDAAQDQLALVVGESEDREPAQQTRDVVGPADLDDLGEVPAGLARPSGASTARRGRAPQPPLARAARRHRGAGARRGRARTCALRPRRSWWSSAVSRMSPSGASEEASGSGGRGCASSSTSRQARTRARSNHVPTTRPASFGGRARTRSSTSSALVSTI